MAETYILLKKLPDRKLRKQVRNFLHDDDVSLVDSSGLLFTVKIKRGKMVLSQQTDIEPRTKTSSVGKYPTLATM
ncbi:MAG: hypothetical protein ACTSUB_00415 [Candidatus Thorarchaeota archaeon]